MVDGGGSMHLRMDHHFEKKSSGWTWRGRGSFGWMLQTWSLSSCAANASAKPTQAAAKRPSVVVARPKYRLAESNCAEAAVVQHIAALEQWSC